MYGSKLERLIHLTKYLVLHPSNIHRYIGTCISNNKTPLDLELPWISYSAIDFLEKFIRPNYFVAEFGGGGSTIYFAKRTERVICVESEEAWASKIFRHLKNLNLYNVAINVHPYDPNDLRKFEKSDFLNCISGYYYDLILVDCFDHSAILRPECFHFAEKYIKEGGCIIVDDSWRYPEIRRSNNAKYWKEFRSIGPCRVGITTTDLFFY